MGCVASRRTVLAHIAELYNLYVYKYIYIERERGRDRLRERERCIHLFLVAGIWSTGFLDCMFPQITGSFQRLAEISARTKQTFCRLPWKNSGPRKPCWQKPCWQIYAYGLHGYVGASARVALSYLMQSKLF